MKRGKLTKFFFHFCNYVLSASDVINLLRKKVDMRQENLNFKFLFK